MLPLLAIGMAKLVAPAVMKGVKSMLSHKAAKVVGGLGAAVGTTMVANKLTSGGNAMPGLPALQGGLPALQNQQILQQSPGGLPVPWFKGPGGKLQMPWNDPRIPEYLKQFALDDAYLHVYYRAPKGYVIVRDKSGRAFAVNKTIAKQFGLWKQAAKPPISATDYKHYKRNRQIEKTLRKIAAPALKKHGSHTVAVTSKKRK
jgi:hypothetical protein